MKVLLVSDFHINVYCWRKEIIDALLERGDEVALAVPYGEKLEYFRERGCMLYDVILQRHSVGILDNLTLIKNYKKIIKDYAPDLVLLYGSKGMLYCGLICKQKKIPYIVNVNGLGTANDMGFPVKQIIYSLYKMVVPHAYCVFFQNKANMEQLSAMGIKGEDNILLPGSGVNLETFSLLPYLDDTHPINFLFCARVMREKGIYEFVEAAKKVHEQNNNVEFNIVGMCDDDTSEQYLKDNSQYVTYHGFTTDVKRFIEEANCIVLPSFYGEGISNSLLESAASGRPIITTDMPGCRETVEDGVTGYIIKPRQVESLVDAMDKFMKLPNEKQAQMGQAGRAKVEREFSRQLVVKAYMEKIETLGK